MFIFGSGLDQLAQQRNQADATNIGLAQSDQALRQRAIDVGQQRQMEAQRQTADQQNQQFAFQAQQAAQQQADQENQFQFGLQRQDKAAATAEDTRRFNIGAAQTQQQIDASKGQNDYAEAVNAIENGDVTTTDDLDKSFKSLTPTQKQRAAMYLSMKTKKQGQDYQSVAAAAAAATGIVAPPFNPVTPPKAHWWSSAPEAPKPPAPLTEDEAMAKLAAVKPLAKFLPALTWDFQTQKFLPAIPKPEGWQPITGPVAQADAGGAITPPPGRPMAGPAPFAFNTAAPQPTTVTAGVQPLAPGNTGLTPRVTTKAQYDVLQSGQMYIGSDGQTYQKP